MTNLTIPQIKALPAKRARFGFGNRLYLDVSATGCKSWSFIWRDQNQTVALASGKKVGLIRTFGLGSFDAGVMPKEARDLADDAARKVRMGIDPIKEREQNRIASVVSTVTFREVLQVVINQRSTTRWKKNPDKQRTSADKWAAQINLHVPTIVSLPVRKVTDDIAVAALLPVFQKSVTTYDYMISMCAAVMDNAIANKQHPGPNPFRFEGHLKERVGDRVVSAAVAAATKKKQASLPYAEAPAFMARLSGLDGAIARCLAFLTMTGVRTDEARCARWSEIDFANKVWEIPGIRMKASQDHAVPLSDQALALLLKIKAEALARGEELGEFVFSASNGQPIDYKGMYKKMCGPATKMQKGKKVWTGNFGLAGVACPHGMRTTFSTWAEEQLLDGVPRWSEKAITASIAHAHGSQADRSYLRSQKMAERRDMMQAYADFLTAVAGGNVVSMKEAA